MAKYTGIKVYFVAPPTLGMREDMIQYMKKLFDIYRLGPPLEDLAKKVNVFYVTEIPVGSLGDRLDDYEESKKHFVIL